MQEILIEIENVALPLLKAGCIRFGDFTFVSGIKSPVYIDTRRLRSFPNQKYQIIQTYCAQLSDLEFDLLADVPTSITPIVSSLSDFLEIPQITPRLDQKDYGSGNKIDGAFHPGQRAILIDDLVTSGKSILQSASILRTEGLEVSKAVVLLDYQKGGTENLAKAGIKLYSAFPVVDILRFYKERNLVREKIDEAIAFVQAA